MKSITKWISIFLALLVIFSSAASLALADNDFEVSAYWVGEETETLTVHPDDDSPQLGLEVWSGSDFTLWIEVTKRADPSYSQVIVENLDVPMSIEMPYYEDQFYIPIHALEEGNYDVDVIVSSTYGTVADNLSLNVVVDNNAPVWTNLFEDHIIDEEETITFMVSATDADGDALEYAHYDNPDTDAELSMVDGIGAYFEWTPDREAGDSGIGHKDYVFRFTASDGINLIEEYINIRVMDLDFNYPPVLTEIGDQTVQVGEELSIIVEAEDENEDDVLTYAINPVLGGSSFSEQTFTWTPVEEQLGEHEVTFTVSDGELSDSETITITVVEAVNFPPVFNQIYLTMAFVSEGETLDLDLSATDIDGDVLAYSLEPTVENVHFNEETGEFSWTPDATQGRDAAYRFTASVTDNINPPVTQQVSVLVIDTLSAPPTIDFIGKQEVEEGDVLEFDIVASDVDSEELSFEMDACPRSLWERLQDLFNFFDERDTCEMPVEFVDLGTGIALVTFSPDYDFVTHPDTKESVRLAFRVTDGDSFSDWTKVLIDVHDVNRLPQITSEPVEEANVSVLYQYDVEAEDADSEDVLRYGLTSSPIGMIINSATGEIEWIPTEVGEFNVRVVVSDSIDEDAQEFTVTVSENEAPVANSQTVNTLEDTAVDITLTGSDSDGEVVAYTLTSNPGNGVLSGDLPDLVYTPAENFNGEDSFSFTVTDNDGFESNEATVTIVVESVNDLPTAESMVVTTFEDTPVEITLVAEDPDGEIVAYMLTHPSNGALSGVAPNIIYTPAENFNGEDSFTFRAVDDSGDRSNEATVIIQVTPVNDQLMITSRPVYLAKEDQLYQYQVVAVDPDNDPLTYELLEGPSGMTISSTGLVSWTPFKSETVQVKLRVTSGEDAAEQRYTINAREAYRNIKFSSVQLTAQDVAAGEVFSVHVNMENNGEKDLRGNSVTVMLPELGVQRSTGEFTLEQGDKETVSVAVPVPYHAQPGEYLVKVVVNNGHYHDTVYRMVNIW